MRSTMFQAVQPGVQFTQCDQDVLLAGLLLNACVFPHDELSMKRYDISVLKREILSFLEGEVKSHSLDLLKPQAHFAKQNQKRLYCIVYVWIEGTTSKAIYGKDQKEFNSHACVKCENWFHKHCLHVCGIKPPKRTQDFICPNCTIPPTVPWSHPKYVKNVLTIIILHCLQHHKFLENI